MAAVCAAAPLALANQLRWSGHRVYKLRYIRVRRFKGHCYVHADSSTCQVFITAIRKIVSYVCANQRIIKERDIRIGMLLISHSIVNVVQSNFY